MKITDVIIPTKSANSMIRVNWEYNANFIEEKHSIWRSYYYDPEDYEITFRPRHRDAIAWIRLTLDFTFKVINAEFLEGKQIDEAVPAKGQLLKSLQQALMEELSEHDIFSFEKDVEKYTMAVFPSAYEYLNKVLREKYNQPDGVNDNLVVLCIPKPLWPSYGLVNAYAYYSPNHEHSVFPSRDDYTGQWVNAIAVHEYFHHFQHQQKILLTPSETGMTREDFTELAAIIEGYEDVNGLDGIAQALSLPVSLLKRIQLVTNKLDEYSKEYYNVLTERQAHAEQFNFIKSQGVSTAKIVATMQKQAERNPNWPKLKELIEKSEEIAADSYQQMLKMIEE
jgi:hypothetical protein